MVQECKYRLPCNWCDKYNRPCEAIEYEVFNLEQECDHEWRLVELIKHTGGEDIHERCYKCGAMRLRSNDGTIYESGIWQP